MLAGLMLTSRNQTTPLFSAVLNSGVANYEGEFDLFGFVDGVNVTPGVGSLSNVNFEGTVVTQLVSTTPGFGDTTLGFLNTHTGSNLTSIKINGVTYPLTVTATRRSYTFNSYQFPSSGILNIEFIR